MTKLFRRIIRTVWLTLILGLLMSSCTIYSISIDAFGLFGGLPSMQSLERPESELASEIFSADGVLLGKYYRHNRTPVPYKELSDKLVTTLLVTEDFRFWEHSGVDFRSLVRVFVKTILLGQNAGGGSTISQQLAKNLFKTRDLDGKLSDISIFRMPIIKIKEWIVAIQLENSYTKKEIIAMYLNTIPYGNNSFGIKVAAQTYFDKHPSELNYNESAILVGLLNAPTRFNPIRNPYLAKRKRTQTLDNLRKYGKITQPHFDSLDKSGFGLNFKVKNENTGQAQYFRSVIGNWLQKWCKIRGYDLWKDGLKIYTTIDSRLQQHAENAVGNHMKYLQGVFDKHWGHKDPWLDKNGRMIKGFIDSRIKRTSQYRALKNQFGDSPDSINYHLNNAKKIRVFSWEGEKDTILSVIDSLKYYMHFLHTGFMAMNPHNGHIKAWVGGINHKYFKYDHVLYGKRNPGSTFKPFVYATAIEDGYSPCFEVQDIAITWNLPGQNPPTWTPDNCCGPPTGETMTLRQGQARSVNTIAARVASIVGGPERIANMAHMLGIESHLNPVPSLSLGGGSAVSVFEMVGAYSTFVNKGVSTQPFYITRIEDKNGAIIEEPLPKRKEAISKETAYLMVHMLKGGTEEEGGTASHLNPKILNNNEVGGKTGTTQNASDGWFMGITKDLVAGAWVGAKEPSIRFRNWYMGSGARTALPIWEKFMLDVYADKSLGIETGPFPPPDFELSVELDCEKHSSTNQEIRQEEIQ